MKKGYMIALCILLISCFPIAGEGMAGTATAAAATDASVVDMFGRELNSNGIELVDWQGYIANPYIQMTVIPPVSASYPVTINLNAQGSSRLMMDLPSTVSATGATKTLTFASASETKDFKLEIHPDRVGGNGDIENYTLSLLVQENNGNSHAQTIPIRVTDQDENAATTFPLLFDYRFDTITNYFSNPGIKAASEQAIKDWFYFFDMAPFDTVAAGAETNYVPNDNFNGNTTVTNNQAYNGEWVILRGLNDPHSTGWTTSNGPYHTRGGVQAPGPIHRSIGAVLDFFPNFSAQTDMNDDNWYLTQNDPSTCTVSCATDIYSVIMHEFGHGLVFTGEWDGMAAYVASGGNDPDVVAYQGYPVPIDGGYHIPGEQQYWDRISGQNGGRTHYFPSKRWMLTKLTLLVAENAGWKLNRNLTPFLAPSIVTASLPNGTKGSAYSQTLAAKGGVPFYDWNVTSGSLPPGLTLNRFTGAITGTISASAPQNSYTFTAQLRDYDTGSAPVTKSFTINLGTTTNELVANYLFNETSGTAAADASGNGKTATLTGGTSWVAGHAGNALSLNGSTGYASLPAGIVNGTTSLTIAAWVKANSLSNWTRIFDFGTGTTANMFLTPQPGAAGLRFAITTGGSGGEQRISSTTAFPTGVWKHVAVTLSGSTGTLYVDGAQVATNTSMTLTPSSLGNTTQNWIGRSEYGDPYFNGAIDDFRIYNRALGASEIASLYGGPTIADISSQGTALASFVSSWESLAGLNDTYEPTSSNDRGHPVYGNWDNPGTTQWVEYDFSSNKTISKSDVYWFDDNEGIDLPASCSIQYWNGTAWVNVGSPSGLGVLGNQYNTTTFTPVTTNKIRLNMTAKAGVSTGLEKWKVYGF
ncbi:LamG-like jellyroll fold domain-containing protein [Cohnella suwonensis]|uniref:LamG-like jellyroll fold domain-containing protein n=1 Tax=Cohnella suwonensis TaxID=696072 RepID=A0ABW0LRJ6_9BACL